MVICVQISTIIEGTRWLFLWFIFVVVCIQCIQIHRMRINKFIIFIVINLARFAYSHWCTTLISVVNRLTRTDMLFVWFRSNRIEQKHYAIAHWPSIIFSILTMSFWGPSHWWHTYFMFKFSMISYNID